MIIEEEDSAKPTIKLRMINQFIRTKDNRIAYIGAKLIGSPDGAEIVEEIVYTKKSEFIATSPKKMGYKQCAELLNATQETPIVATDHAEGKTTRKGQ